MQTSRAFAEGAHVILCSLKWCSISAAPQADRATKSTHDALLFHTRTSFEHISAKIMKILTKLLKVSNEKALNIPVMKKKTETYLDKNPKSWELLSFHFIALLIFEVQAEEQNISEQQSLREWKEGGRQIHLQFSLICRPADCHGFNRLDNSRLQRHTQLFKVYFSQKLFL